MGYLRKVWLTIFTGVAVFLVTISVSVNISYGEKYPDRPINLIVNFGAGGSTDISARLLAKVAEKKLGVPIIIQNKAGGAGTIGVTEVAKAKPDGYTIGTTTSSPMVSTPLMQKVPYDTFKDFDYICGYAGYYYGIFTKMDSPYKSIKDVVEYARKNPGKITYGAVSPAIGIGLKYVELKENIKMGYVTFQSGQELGAAVAGGHLPLVISADVYQWLDSGEVRGLAVVTEKRWQELPNLPTMKELGYDIDLTGWMALAAPAGVPKDRLDMLYEAFRVAANDPEVKSRFEKLHFWAPYITGEEMVKIFQKATREWKPLIEAFMAERGKK